MTGERTVPTQIAVEQYEQHRRPGQKDAVYQMYGEHLAILRARARRLRAMALFADDLPGMPEEDEHASRIETD